MAQVGSIEDAAVQRWRARLQNSHSTLRAILKRVGEEEADWAPDLGLQSIRDHLWAIAESERWLVVRLTHRRPVPAQRSVHPADIAFDEIVRLVDICHRNLQVWFDGAQSHDITSRPAESGDEYGACVEDLLFHHLEYKAAHTSAIRSLLRLIDPVRCGAL